MNNDDKCRSNNNMILHKHYSFLTGTSRFITVLWANGPRAVMIHGVPVKTYNALQNHIIVLLLTERIIQLTNTSTFMA